MKFIKKNLIVISIVAILIGLVSMLGLKKYLVEKKDVKEITTEETIQIEKKEEDKENIIENVYVDIKGAVAKPGVYEIAEDKKVIDVVNLAGGLTDQADTSMINLAKKVTSEMVVIIYTKEEVKKATEPNQIIKYVDKECVCPNIKNDACLNTGASTNNSSSTTKKSTKEETKTTTKVNINTATLEELQTLNGIGEGKAKAIIQYREEKGEFKNIEELKEVSGIGDSLYEKVKDNITV